MKLEEIKKAVDDGKTVHWTCDSYTVIKNRKTGEYYVEHAGGNLTGLTWADGVTMNFKAEDFYIAE